MTTSDGETSASDTTSDANQDETSTGASSTGESSTSTGELSTSNGELSTSTGESSTGDDTSTGEPAGLSWALDVYPVFVEKSCNHCHMLGTGGLWMSTAEDSYMNLVGAEAWSTYKFMNRVEPGEPAASYMLHKLLGTHGPYGPETWMPLGKPMLPKSTLDLVKQWILDGALP